MATSNDLKAIVAEARRRMNGTQDDADALAGLGESYAA